MVSWSNIMTRCYAEWYDPVTMMREDAPKMNECILLPGFGVIKDKFVYSVGGYDYLNPMPVSMLDVSSRSPSWVPMANMLVSRKGLGVGVLDNCIYAVSYTNIYLFFIINIHHI